MKGKCGGDNLLNYASRTVASGITIKLWEVSLVGHKAVGIEVVLVCVLHWQ